MRRSAQLAFDLAPDPAYGREDFLVADCNREAVAWLDRWPLWPGPALVLHGPDGSGKTHLARTFIARTGGRLLDRDDLAASPPEALLAGVPALVVDDFEPLLVPGTETLLLHLFNVAREQGRHLLLTAAAAPSRLPIALPDLRSRLLAAPAVGIGAPDEPMLRALLVKLFADRQIAVDEAVLAYLLARIERSFAAARTVVARLDRVSLGSGMPVTTRLARTVLADADDPE